MPDLDGRRERGLHRSQIGEHIIEHFIAGGGGRGGAEQGGVMLGGGDAAVAQHGLDFGHGYAVGEVEGGEGVAAGVGACALKARGALDIALAEDGEVFIGHNSPFIPCFSCPEQNIIFGEIVGAFAAGEVILDGLLDGGREGRGAELIALASPDGDLGLFIVIGEMHIAQTEGAKLGVAQTAAQEGEDDGLVAVEVAPVDAGGPFGREQRGHFLHAHEMGIGLALGADFLARGHQFRDNGILGLEQTAADGEVKEQTQDVETHGDGDQFIAVFAHTGFPGGNGGGFGGGQGFGFAEGQIGPESDGIGFERVRGHVVGAEIGKVKIHGLFGVKHGDSSFCAFRY